MIFMVLITAWLVILGVTVAACRAAAVGDRQFQQAALADPQPVKPLSAAADAAAARHHQEGRHGGHWSATPTLSA